MLHVVVVQFRPTAHECWIGSDESSQRLRGRHVGRGGMERVHVGEAERFSSQCSEGSEPRNSLQRNLKGCLPQPKIKKCLQGIKRAVDAVLCTLLKSDEDRLLHERRGVRLE